MKLIIMEWNIHQQGRQWNGKTKISNDYDIPLWIIDQIDDEVNIVVFTEFNCHAKNIELFYDKLFNKGFSYSTTNYSCGWSNDILIAVKTSDNLTVEEVTYVKAYPDLPNTTFDTDWSNIPENLRVNIKIGEKCVNFWGIRIKDLNGDYEKRRTEMKIVMNWIKDVDGINIIVGDFNNLRENTTIKEWNLTVLDKLLGEKFIRIAPKNHSWGVSKSVKNNTFDGYIKNDHLIYSKETGISIEEIEPYKWTYLSHCNYSLKEKYYGKQNLDIPIGEPDHGILIVKASVTN